MTGVACLSAPVLGGWLINHFACSEVLLSGLDAFHVGRQEKQHAHLATMTDFEANFHQGHENKSLLDTAAK